jgi:hypothetical protein
MEEKMSVAGNPNGLETSQLASLTPGESKKMEKKSYIEFLHLENNAPPVDEDRILDVIRKNEATQFERISCLINEIAEYYGDK